MAETKRKFIAVSLREDFYERAKAVAEERDVRVTAWVRELIMAELKRLSS